MIYLAHIVFPSLLYLVLSSNGESLKFGHFSSLALLIIIWQAAASIGINKKNFKYFYGANVLGISLFSIIFFRPEIYGPRYQGLIMYGLVISLIGLGLGLAIRSWQKHDRHEGKF